MAEQSGLCRTRSETPKTGFLTTRLIFRFSYTTLSHNLIKEKFLDLIEPAFKKTLKNDGTLYLACYDEKAFFASTDNRGYKLWSCQNVCDALSYPLDNIYINFGNKLYRQIVGIPMGTNCAPLVAELFLFCYERDFIHLFLMIAKPILLRHLIQRLDI